MRARPNGTMERYSPREMEESGMRASRRILIVSAALLCFAAPAWAGGADRLGTAGAQELRIPVGAASIALGGASVAVGDGLGNLYWNPASLAAVDHSEAMVSYSTYLADCDVNYGAIATPLGSQGVIAASVKVLNIGDITVTTEDSPEGTGQILAPSYAVFGLSYGRRMTDRVLVGATGMMVMERIADMKAQGFALDLGVQYDTGWQGLRFGFAMKNVGSSMQFEGPNLEQRVVLPTDDPSAQPHVVSLQATAFEIPTFLQLGAAYDVPISDKHRATVVGTFQSNNFSTDEYRLGAEYHVGSHLILRGGFQGQLAVQEQSQQSGYLYNFSYGAGLNFNMGDLPVQFDWAGTRVGEFFDDFQQFSLRMAF
jgi:hypothetical protein